MSWYRHLIHFYICEILKLYHEINYFKYLTILQLSIFCFFFFGWVLYFRHFGCTYGLPLSLNCSVVVYVLLQFKAYLYHSFHPKDHKETLPTKPKAMLALNLLSNYIIFVHIPIAYLSRFLTYICSHFFYHIGQILWKCNKSALWMYTNDGIWFSPFGNLLICPFHGSDFI